MIYTIRNGLVYYTLNPDDQARARRLARAILDYSVAMGAQPRRGKFKNELETDILGTEGELAGHKVTRLDWITEKHGGVYQRGAPDLGLDVDIKTRSEDWHELPVYEKDPDHWRYILVTRETWPTYCLRGWLFVREAKQLAVHISTDTNEGWYVKQGLLRPILTLAELRPRRLSVDELLPLPE